MKTQRIVYWVSTALMCAMFLFSAGMYFVNTEMIEGFFESFNYPTYIVIPLAIAKVLGVIMVLWRGSKWITEWAYAGFFFDVVLAFFAHQQAGDDVTQTLIVMILVLLSYFFGKEVRH
ncbi:hypothetical protein ULMS_04160 [Patiriisocius marinistellae]|uniref:DoxX family protein n=1 Tax=Patiriisocius marinistellae TaxID=2494560 RepID=A0A5J4FUR0_9FLAO|nr:DoxX family protein [Patiriisocius marinistellae]GEQ84908.1 hypothetical protein ULMS_04160 [Patiriisocius marinistellae]